MKSLLPTVAVAVVFLAPAANRSVAQDLFPDKGLESAVRYEVFAKRYNEEPLTKEDVKNISQIKGKGKEIKSLEGVEHCIAVQLVDLEDNAIEDIAQLSSLKLLQSVNLAGNKIKSIQPLAELEKVQYLELSGNEVTDITPIKKMKNMMSLYLSNNKIEDIQVVTELPKVWSLYLAGNPLKDFGPISKCRRVDTLDLSNCGVTDLSFLKPLTELKRLMLIDNKIEDLTPLVEMAKADEERRFSPFWNIHLKGNPLSDAAKESQIKELKEMGARIHLD
jgi:internalin A